MFCAFCILIFNFSSSLYLPSPFSPTFSPTYYLPPPPFPTSTYHLPTHPCRKLVVVHVWTAGRTGWWWWSHTFIQGLSSHNRIYLKLSFSHHTIPHSSPLYLTSILSSLNISWLKGRRRGKEEEGRGKGRKGEGRRRKGEGGNSSETFQILKGLWQREGNEQGAVGAISSSLPL